MLLFSQLVSWGELVNPNKMIAFIVGVRSLPHPCIYESPLPALALKRPVQLSRHG